MQGYKPNIFNSKRVALLVVATGVLLSVSFIPIHISSAFSNDDVVTKIDTLRTVRDSLVLGAYTSRRELLEQKLATLQELVATLQYMLAHGQVASVKEIRSQQSEAEVMDTEEESNAVLSGTVAGTENQENKGQYIRKSEPTGNGGSSMTKLDNPLSQSERNELVSWLSSLQYVEVGKESYGALTWSDGIAVYEEGTERPLKRVVPYFAHIAVLGVLDTAHEQRLTVAQRWIEWYLDHINAAHGVPLDTWYSVDGTYSTTCPVSTDPLQCDTVDAEDSSAALFLTVIDRYIDEGGDKKFIRSRENDVRAVTDTLLGLIDNDGLSWAKDSYRVKYLMDNVEVLSGLRAAAEIEKTLYHNTARSNMLRERAAKTESALYGAGAGSLLNASDKQFYVYKDEVGNRETSDMQTWYPDLMVQLWPYAYSQWYEQEPMKQVSVALGVSSNCSALTQHTGGKHEPVIAYVLRHQGEEVGRALTSCMYEELAPAFEWPTNIGDIGWLLRD